LFRSQRTEKGQEENIKKKGEKGTRCEKKAVCWKSRRHNTWRRQKRRRHNLYEKQMFRATPGISSQVTGWGLKVPGRETYEGVKKKDWTHEGNQDEKRDYCTLQEKSKTGGEDRRKGRKEGSGVRGGENDSPNYQGEKQRPVGKNQIGGGGGGTAGI